MGDPIAIHSKPVVAVDIDEVLAQFIPSLATFHNEVYGGTALTSESFVSYEFHHVWGGTKEECSHKMDQFFLSTHFRENVAPMPKAFENLVELMKDFDLHIVTARQHAVEDLTREWINKHFPNIFSGIHFGNHYSKSGKSRSKAKMCKEIGAVLLIDDSLSYATQVSREGIHVILFGDYAWNQVKAKTNLAENVEIVFSPHTKDEVIIHDYSDSIFQSDESNVHTSDKRIVYRVHDWDIARVAIRKVLSNSHYQGSLVSTSTISDLKVAVIQLCSINDKLVNTKTIQDLIAQARRDAVDGIDLVCLPECCIFMGMSMEETLQAAEDISCESPSIQFLANLAKLYHVFISVGGFPEKRSDIGGAMSNCHFILDREGNIVRPCYRKMHLFDCPLMNVMESRLTVAGTTLAVININGWSLGLSICYDLRFPVFFQSFKEVDVILVPSAFTVPTGSAHWEVLLRARAIENQTYVIAAAQSGQHNDQRISYGHSMVVDPWGKVIAHLCDEREGYLLATLRKDLIVDIRSKMPVLVFLPNMDESSWTSLFGCLPYMEYSGDHITHAWVKLLKLIPIQ